MKSKTHSLLLALGLAATLAFILGFVPVRLLADPAGTQGYPLDRVSVINWLSGGAFALWAVLLFLTLRRRSPRWAIIPSLVFIGLGVAILAAHPDTLEPASMKTTAKTWAGTLTVVLAILAVLAYRGRGPASLPRWERIVSIATLVLVLGSWLFYMLPRTLVSMADAHITFVHQPIDTPDTCKRAQLFRDWSDSGEYNSPRWMYKVATWSPSTKALAQCRLARHYAEFGTTFTCDSSFAEGKEALEQCVQLKCKQMVGGFDSVPTTLSQYCASQLETQ